MFLCKNQKSVKKSVKNLFKKSVKSDDPEHPEQTLSVRTNILFHQ